MVNQPAPVTKASVTPKPQKVPGKYRNALLTFMHWGVVAGSVGLVVLISYDTFKNVSFLANKTYLQVQFWICLFFIADVIVDYILSPKHMRYLMTHLLFLLISIPYLNIISVLHVDVSPELGYTLRFIPMVRAAYVLAIVSGAMHTSWAKSMFSGYLVILLASLYFGSMMFYVEEHDINPGLPSFWASLWWACMNITTTGCNIEPMTQTGKVLEVLLSGEGLIIFPLFTVYLTNLLNKQQSKAKPDI